MMMYPALILAVCAAPPTVGTDVGQMHPDFALPGIDGRLIRLSDYRGHKVLLINFASW